MVITQHLPVDSTIQPDDRLRQTGEENSPDERPGHRARECEVVIFSSESL